MTITKRRFFTLFVVVLCVVTTQVPAMAQRVTGTISGTVTDPTGAVLAGATVTLINQRTGDARTLTAKDDGRFVFSAVQPDTYTIKIEQAGFEALELKSTVLSATEDLALGELQLKPGRVTETIEVTARGGRVETESSDLNARLTADQISQLQTKGRDITSLLRLMPGTSYIDDVESVGEGFGTDLPNFNGQRGRSTVTTVDGLNASEPSGSNKVSMTTNQDAIGEVKVLRNNYAAEYGNNGGGMVQIITKNGGQTYHGSGYYFLRNEALNANDYINNHTFRDATQTATLPRALYRHNIWGVTLGGPVKVPWLYPNRDRKKLFFFYSYEKPHTITPQKAHFVRVPTALERTGDFSQTLNGTSPVFITDPTLSGTCNATTQTACFHDPSRATPANPTGLNIIPKSRLDPSGLAILNYFPLPNTVGVNNYVIQKSVDVPKWSQVIRFDFILSDKDSFNWKGQWWTSDNEGLQTSGWPSGDANQWGISSHYLYKDNGMTLGWVHIFTGNVVNEVIVGLRHDTEGFIPSTGIVEGLQRDKLGYNAPQLFPGNNLLGTIPRATSWGGFSGGAVPANINWLDRWGLAGQDYIKPSVAQNLSINRGSHQYKVGAYFEDLFNSEAAGGNWSGTFNFSSNSSGYTAALGNTGFPYANAAIGSFNSYTENEFRPHTNLEIKLLQGYAQDQWKLTPHFTLNYGVRLGYHTQFYQRDKLASNFDPVLYTSALAPLLWQPFCTLAVPPGTACSTSNRRARNPVTGALSTNLQLVGTFVKGAGNPLDGIALQADPTVPAGFKQATPVDVEPRLGFAWDIFGRGKTVLRAMGGVYHAPRAGGGTTGGNLVSNPPFQRSVTINFNNGGATIQNLSNLASQCQTDALNCPALQSPPTVNAVTVETSTPTTYNFSLGIQQDLGFKTVVEATYVGSLSRHLGERRNINTVPDGARFLPQNRNPFSTSGAIADSFLRPFQGFGDINTVMYTGTSNYNALQVQVNRWYARSFQFGVVYTWSKTMDYASDDSSDVFFPRPYRQFNYGPANFDQTQIFTVHYIWDLPSLGKVWNNGFVKAVFDGWQLAGISSLVSGVPATVDTAPSYSSGSPITDFTGGTINARANQVCDPNQAPSGLVGSNGNPVLINTACFVRPAVLGDIGNTGRNTLRLPGIIASDLSLSKSVHLRERGVLQFRWEAYNLFNHTNFKSIDTSLTFDATGKQTNGNFGAATAVLSPRVMQASMRVSF
jgi:hypothetical protein